MKTAARLFIAACALAVGAAACDSSTSGEGSYTVRVEWDAGVAPLGAALVFLGAPGLGTAAPMGDVMIWQNTPPGEEGGLRVLLIDTGVATSLRFTVEASGTPAATLLGLATQANNPLVPPVEGYRVVVLRNP
jgi:hypothetical protein